ncbi:MAG: hypothetical protein P0Y53_10695 [Candidatus Pseudobacter hemicellulosilyticus]|uniref:Uncharacterized protein n=1 Tax=Candidatus Pseudobacter hemicellulosilyticus TaxID=3121375 RepID=A0AAJ5WYK8_9BACT|nr:MAG: hypothetical protein P0Y53_10695 [Pseudobacter sp.]
MHGNIYEIALQNEYGFGYVQVVITSELGLAGHVLIRTLDYFSDTPYKGELSFFATVDELAYPSFSLALPATRGKSKWRLIGNVNVPQGYRVPKCKFDPTTRSWESPDWDKISWYVITNLVANGLDGGYTHSQVKHLPFWKHCSQENFKIKLTMFWMKKQRRRIEDYFNIAESYHYSCLYYEVSNTVFYADIDNDARGVPI